MMQIKHLLTKKVSSHIINKANLKKKWLQLDVVRFE